MMHQRTGACGFCLSAARVTLWPTFPNYLFATGSMKQLLDFLPLIVFFSVYKFFDIYIASGALVAATALQVALTYALFKKVEKVQLIVFGIAAVFGTLTLVLQDENFIKWKVTVIYWLLAITLGLSQLLNKSLMKKMLGKELQLPDSVMAKITWYWTAFFALCGVANIYIAYRLPLETWVNFKVFGITALTFINTLITFVYIYKNLSEEQRKDLE
jgi:intracellular septation protein